MMKSTYGDYFIDIQDISSPTIDFFVFTYLIYLAKGGKLDELFVICLSL